MSEHITHIAVFENCARLAIHSQQVHPLFKESLKQYPDIGLLASGSRGNHLFAVPLIEQAKKSQSTDKQTKMHLAAALGWMTHRAADLQMKPLFKLIDEEKEPYFKESENQIYHDAVTFQKIYEGGKEASLSEKVYFSPASLATDMRSHPAANGINVEATELLMSQLVQRTLLDQQAFIDQTDDFEQWLTTFLDRRNKFSEDFRVYIEAYQNPDPKKMKKYIEDVNYYDDDDEIIQLAKALQKGKQVSIDLQDALAKAESQSQFAQALRRGCINIQEATRFYQGAIDKSTLYDTFEVFYEDHRL